MKEYNDHVLSVRNTLIPVTKVECEGEPEYLAVFVHGFKAERTEGGRFLTVARELARHHFTCIMMDQCGCGESSEPFDLYCLANPLDDVQAGIESVRKPSVRRIVLVGYSMGGRVVSAYSALKRHQIDTLALWTSAIMPADDLKPFMYGPDGHSMVAEAEENGFAMYYNAFDNTWIHLSKAFYDGMLKYDVPGAVRSFAGNVILCHGLVDDTVLPKYSIEAYDELTTEKDRELVLIWDANHGFGLWDDKMYQSAILTGKTTEFILKNTD